MRTRFLKVLGLALAIGVPSFAGCQGSSNPRGAGDHVDDAVITANVRAALGRDGMRAGGIEVETRRGIVHLGGVVETREEKSRAARSARSIRGVTRVRNLIEVNSLANGAHGD